MSGNEQPSKSKKSRKTIRLNIESLADKFVRREKKHDIYFCPYCDEVKDSPDTSGKLYFHRDKGIGWCFRCEVSLVHTLKFGDASDMDVAAASLRQSINKRTMRQGTWPAEDLRKMLITEPYEYSEITDVGMEYLQSRENPFLPFMIDYLNMRERTKTMKGVGIILPTYYADRIVKYQIRYSNPEWVDGKTDSEGNKLNNAKYFTSPGEKIFYSPNRILDGSFTPISEINIVEGKYDAIAQLVRGKPNPLAILGKTFTPFHVFILKSLTPDKVTVSLDDKYLSRDCVKALEEILPLSEIEIEDLTCPDNGLYLDPEEYLHWELTRQNENKLEEYTQNVEKLVGAPPCRSQCVSS